MQKTLLSFVLMLFTAGVFAQGCNDLFFSEYVEGYANNKALEIYNPTDQAIELSDYSIVRFRNGSTAPTPERFTQLPQGTIEPYDVYVIVIDQRDTALWDSQFDKPAWEGHNIIDTLRDGVTGEPLVDSLGNVLFGPQFDANGNALFGDEYNEEYDLQCKADVFLNPTFEEMNSMYFNGNDAVVLIKGTTLSPSGDNLIDVIGVIGEDPEITIMEPAWVDENGSWLTRNRTLVRRPEVTQGRNDPSMVIAPNGTFTGTEWFSNRNNDFSFLGVHNCACASGEQFDRFSCSTGPIASTFDLNTVNFQIFPNPNSTGTLTINAEAKIEMVTVFNVVGQQIDSERFGGDIEQVNVDISNLQRGIYLLHVAFEGQQLAIQKLIVE